MKEIVHNKQGNLAMRENTLEFSSHEEIKVKITKALITYEDLKRLKANPKEEEMIPLISAVSVVSDPHQNQSYTLGHRVYIEPYSSCGVCYECKTDNPKKCLSLSNMGVEENGFLCDFKIAHLKNVISLPDVVDDLSALYIHHVATCIDILDKLSVQKGEHIVIFGSCIYSNILCQLSLYYQAIPILVDNNKQNIALAKKHGTYYCIENENEVTNMIKQITGGRMAENVAYFSSSKVHTKYITDVCKNEATVGYFGELETNCFLSFKAALKKHLRVYFITNSYINTHAAINILATRAVHVADFINDTVKFEDAITRIEELLSQDEQLTKISNTVVDI